MNVHQKKPSRIQKRNQEKILDAALQMFSEFGFRGTTIDMISRHAEMSKPNLLYYFAGKQDIYQTLLRSTLESWLEPLGNFDPDGDPLEEIRLYIERKLEFSRDNPRASRLFAYEIMQGAKTIDSALRGPLKIQFDKTAAIIGRWMAQGRLRPVDPRHLILMLWATTQHYADFDAQTRALLDAGAKPEPLIETALDTMTAVFLNGLKPAVTRRKPRNFTHG